MALKTITVDTTTELGDSGPSTVTTKTMQFTPAGGYDGSITVKARRTGSGMAYVPIPYRRLCLNGTVSDGDFGSAVITGAGSSIIEVQGDGLDVALVSVGRTVGSMAVDYTDLLG